MLPVLTFKKNTWILLIKKVIIIFLQFFSVHLSTAPMTVFSMTLSNTIGPSFLSCQASIIPWMNSAALILVLAIKCAQRYVQGSHCEDKHSFSKLVFGLM